MFYTEKTLKFICWNIPQSTGSSSDLSWQSGWALHKKCELVQFPSLHWNWPTGQYRWGQVGGSSEPSRQSLCPSHFHQMGIHLQRENMVFFALQMFTAQKSLVLVLFLEKFKTSWILCLLFHRSNPNKIYQNYCHQKEIINSWYWWTSRRKFKQNKIKT